MDGPINNPIDFNNLSTFFEVARLGNISHASKTLHLSQPAISLQLKKLEESLGQKLFQRERYGLALTEFGRSLLPLSGQLCDLKQRIKSFTGKAEPKVRIRIATSISVASKMIAPKLKEIYDQIPNLSLYLDYLAPHDSAEAVLSRKCDFGLWVGPLRNTRLHAESLFNDEMVLACAHGSDLPKKILRKDLPSLSFLGYSDPLFYCADIVNRKYRNFLGGIEPRLVADDFRIITEGVKQGLGVAFFLRSYIQKELEAKSMRLIAIEKDLLPVDFQLVRNKTSDLEPVFQALLQVLKN